ncbi:GNAT family N-acetyltransferase [Litoreibacter roseus]|nr:GNAT family protein [Litoreibacter roseus]
MSERFGFPVPDWQRCPEPDFRTLAGAHVQLERLSVGEHATELHAANIVDDAIWDYLPYGPFLDQASYAAWVEAVAEKSDPYFMAIRPSATGGACGVASLLRIEPDVGVIEAGHLNFAPALQRTAAATEALFLLIDWAFDAGYRRFEWKCDALNMPSRRAAERLGFQFEGIFRQATIYKGRNRDTAWFSIIDTEWPALRRAYVDWLDAPNFDAEGRQRAPLSACIAQQTGG